MEEITRLLGERHPLIEKLLREGIIKVQEEYIL
mgnify:CR=1 FL=1